MRKTNLIRWQVSSRRVCCSGNTVWAQLGCPAAAICDAAACPITQQETITRHGLGLLREAATAHRRARPLQTASGTMDAHLGAALTLRPTIFLAKGDSVRVVGVCSATRQGSVLFVSQIQRAGSPSRFVPRRLAALSRRGSRACLRPALQLASQAVRDDRPFMPPAPARRDLLALSPPRATRRNDCRAAAAAGTWNFSTCSLTGHYAFDERRELRQHLDNFARVGNVFRGWSRSHHRRPRRRQHLCRRRTLQFTSGSYFRHRGRAGTLHLTNSTGDQLQHHSFHDAGLYLRRPT